MRKISMGRTAIRLGAVAIMVGGIGVVGSSTSYAGGHGTITKEAWGTTAGGLAVDRYTLTNNGIRVRILTYGGILQSIASKNDHDAAWARVTAFGLDEFFLHPQICWADKSDSIRTITNRSV